jgi:hypothetical protein
MWCHVPRLQPRTENCFFQFLSFPSIKFHVMNINTHFYTPPWLRYHISQVGQDCRFQSRAHHTMVSFPRSELVLLDLFTVLILANKWSRVGSVLNDLPEFSCTSSLSLKCQYCKICMNLPLLTNLESLKPL